MQIDFSPLTVFNMGTNYTPLTIEKGNLKSWTEKENWCPWTVRSTGTQFSFADSLDFEFKFKNSGQIKLTTRLNNYGVGFR